MIVKVLFLSAEVAPFVTVGGLSQVMYFLPRALSSRGHEVRIFMPKYGIIEDAQSRHPWKLKKAFEDLWVPLDDPQQDSKKQTKDVIQCNIKIYPKTRTTEMTYFLENSEYYGLRANMYGYKDDHVRFALLSKGCLEWLCVMEQLIEKKDERGWLPDLIQCNDWHTGYFIELARKSARYKKLLAKIPIVLTVHNFHFQGNYDFRYGNHTKQDTGRTAMASLLSPQLLKQNALLRGILYADAINTVSPTHALEVLTPEYGEGLEEILENKRGKVIGILNGLDTKEFNPETDPIIFKKFSVSNFQSSRQDNKHDLQRLFLLEENPESFLLAVSGRLSQQKGWDLLLEVLPHVLEKIEKLQLIVLGTGDDRYRHEIGKLKSQYPDRIGLHLRSDFRLPRKIFSGADVMLIPSIFEPGGIVALEALRYGAVPLVRRTGGLNDIVRDFNPGTKKGNGFSFKKTDPWDLYAAIIEAQTIFRQQTLWQQLVRNCLSYESSWDAAALTYEKWYENVIEEKRRSTSITPHPAYE